MYVVGNGHKKFRARFIFVLLVTFFILAIGIIIWLKFFKSQDSSASFIKESVVHSTQPKTVDFTNQFYKITLPAGWVSLGRQNPFYNQVYYEYKSEVKNYDNRWLRVYVDVFPADYPLRRLLPISVISNQIVPGELSGDCDTLLNAPQSVTNQTWQTKWQGIAFNCNLNLAQENIGTASLNDGYGTTLTNKNGTSHRYFFVYIDLNAHPDLTILGNALKSFNLQ